MTTTSIKTIKATIKERGNGFPDTGDYVPGDDGNLYLIESIDGRIQTASASGAANWIHASVILTDWSDCEEGEEHPSSCVIER